MSERAWLIESRLTPGPWWWMGTSHPAPWTRDSLRAVRFVRKQDAEAAAATLPDSHMAFVSEHQWGLGAEPAPPLPKASQDAEVTEAEWAEARKLSVCEYCRGGVRRNGGHCGECDDAIEDIARALARARSDGERQGREKERAEVVRYLSRFPIQAATLAMAIRDGRHVPAPPASEEAKEAPADKNSCNRHVDCAAADAKARAKGRGLGAEHCHDDCCEDCFGQ